MNEEKKYKVDEFEPYRTGKVEVFELAETQDGRIVAIGEDKIVEPELFNM